MTIFEQLQAFTPFNEQEASDRRLMLQYAGLFSDLLTRDNEMAHLTASCWIVNPDKTKVLLAGTRTARRICLPWHSKKRTRNRA